jgi:hypothetical protein
LANIFLSYNRKSASAAKTLAEDITSIGHTVWYDNNLGGGQAWWDEILNQVRNCDIFIFVLDGQSLTSTDCNREYNYADALGKSILPVLAAEGVSTNLLPPALSKIQFVDYRAADKSAAFRLAKALLSIPLSKKLPDPLPAPPEVPLSYLGDLTSKVEAASLSYEQQSALLLDLKRGFYEEELSEDSFTLLKRLRKRRDLYAAIADDIDELFDSRKKIHSEDKFSSARTESYNDAFRKSEFVQNPINETNIKSESKIADENTKTIKPNNITPAKRIIGAGIGIAIGFLTAGLLTLILYYRGGGGIGGGAELALLILGAVLGWIYYKPKRNKS